VSHVTNELQHALADTHKIDKAHPRVYFLPLIEQFRVALLRKLAGMDEQLEATRFHLC
jgi:hypothetical protein